MLLRMTALIIDLDQLKQLANQHHDDFEVMRYLLEIDDDLPDTDLDAVVTTLAQPIIDAIDCTQCANCCRSLDVYLTESDAQRLAAGIPIPVAEISTRYIDHKAAVAEGEWGQFRARPCAFLAGNLCTVYEHRPESCRIYPVFTPDFRWTLTDLIAGAGLCPIIYNVLIQMLPIVDDLHHPSSD